MRELVVIEFMTLDGVVQAPGHAGEDTDDGFAHGGWTQPYMVDHREFGAAEYVQAGDFLFGRRPIRSGYRTGRPSLTLTTPSRQPSTAGQSMWPRARSTTHPGPAARSSPAMTSNERCSS
jgi:hypothetical protein